jgi:hypothetical protein
VDIAPFLTNVGYAMTRRHLISTFVVAAALAAPAGAFGATSQEIFADASDGQLGAHYSTADLNRAMKDATMQGYGNQIIQITLTNTINNSNSNSNSSSNSNNNTNNNSNTSNSTSNATNNNTSTNTNNNSATGGNASANANSDSKSNSASDSAANAAANGGCCKAGRQVFTPPLRQHHFYASKPGPRPTYGPHPSPGKHRIFVPRRSSTLPFTGSNLATFSSLGAALLSGGLLLRLMARRRQSF